MRYVVRGVLAGAYRGHGRKNDPRNTDRETRTHACVIEPGETWPAHTLCRRMTNMDNLGDQNEIRPPTCPLCLERWKRLVSRGVIPMEPIIEEGDNVNRFSSNPSLPRTPVRRSFGRPPPAPDRRVGALDRTRRIAREHEESERPFEPERRGDWRGSSRDLVVNPGSELTAEQERFVRALEGKLRLGDRQLRIKYGGKSIFVNFYNLPTGVGGAGGGAEAENNRMMFTVKMPQGRGAFASDVAVPEGSVRVEMSVSALPREYRLRAKTTTIERAAEYLADFMNKVAAEVPPRFTHTHTRNGPELTENPDGFREDLAWLVGEYHGKLRTDLSEEELTEKLYDVLTKKSTSSALREADKLLEGHGVEALGPENARGGPPYLYINFGDTYDATIVWSRDDDKIFVAKGGWGDVWSEEGEPSLLQDGWDSWLGSEFENKVKSELDYQIEKLGDGSKASRDAERSLEMFESWDSDQQKQLFEKALWRAQQAGGGGGRKYPEVTSESDGIYVHHLDAVIDKAAELVLGGWTPKQS